ncbi:hypothetical protein KEM56_004164, partial [Ascosphaera pollenicola]
MPSATIQNLPVRPAPQQTATDTDTATADLDAKIASLQEQIFDLTSRRQYLTSTILSSPTLHSLLKRREEEQSQASELLRPLTVQLEKHTRHIDSNLHRLVFSVTSFPYTDPSPHRSDAEKKLLGVRIDVSRRDGGYEKPFYVLLRRVTVEAEEKKGEKEVRLVVHRHTIPEFIPVRELERRYLPVPTADADEDGEEEEEDEVAALKRTPPLPPPPPPSQNLHAFAREIRNALVSWHLRVDAVKLLQHQLSSSALASASNLHSIQATSLEHRFLRLEWRDGRVGRVKLGEQGQIERVVVVSADGGREKDVEFAVQRGED